MEIERNIVERDARRLLCSSKDHRISAVIDRISAVIENNIVKQVLCFPVKSLNNNIYRNFKRDIKYAVVQILS